MLTGDESVLGAEKGVGEKNGAFSTLYWTYHFFFFFYPLRVPGQRESLTLQARRSQFEFAHYNSERLGLSTVQQPQSYAESQ